MGALQILKLVGIGLVAVLVLGGAWMLRDQLIEKGKNIVYAQDNAALVEQQRKQTADDAERLKGQAVYIEHLESQGQQIKEKIRVVQGPCVKDGADDPRLRDFNEWLRSRPPYGGGQAGGGRATQDPVPATDPARPK